MNIMKFRKNNNMEARDLRIGNLVDVGDLIAKIDTIGSVSCWVTFLENDEDMSYTKEVDTKKIKPIPIKEEWLVWFDFTKHGDYFYVYNDKGYEYELLRKGNVFDLYDLGGTLLNTFKYVHEFQNWHYIATREELEIN